MPSKDKAGSGKRQEIPGGWIKAARSIRHHPMLQSAIRKGVWLDLLLMAAHEPTRVSFRGRIVDLQPGQCAVVMSEWAKELGLTPRQLDRIMVSWRSESAVRVGHGPGKAYSLITIENYSVYQSQADRIGESAGERPGKERGKRGETEQEPEEPEERDSDSEPYAKDCSSSDERPSERQLRLVADNAQTDPPKPTDRQLGECFDQHFWPHYPRKVGKPKARAAFIGKAKTCTARAIVAGLRVHRQAWIEAGTDKGFIPHPTTWINQERFLEEPDICSHGDRRPQHERPLAEQEGVYAAGARAVAILRAEREAQAGGRS